VVTAFEFDLHPFDGMLTRGLRIYDASVIHEVWPIIREFARTAPDAVSLTCGIGRAVPAGDYPESIADRPIFFVAFNHCGNPDDVERDTAPLRTGPKPAVETNTRIPYLQIQGANDLAMGFGHRSQIRGGFANDLRSETLDALIDHVSTADGESSFGITAQAGAFGRVDDDATAFTGRSALLEISADTSWEDAAEDDARIAWVRHAMAIVDGDAVTGRYVNEIPDSGPEETRSIYGDATYARLAELKRVWDPDNVFRLNHNVEPAGA